MDGKVIGGELFVDRWVYHKPSLIPDKNGNIVIISKCSFGPLEVYEWGIDSNGKPYEMYKWCENDLYEDENGTKNITFAELGRKTDEVRQSAADNGLSDWVGIYELLLVMCKEFTDNAWNPFNACITWHDFFCFGAGDKIIAANLETLEQKCFEVETYFGYFYPCGDILLAASAMGVLAFNEKTELLWRNEKLAVDGVTFGGISGNVLDISCETDPPGGWVNKRLDIRSGKELQRGTERT